MSSLLGYGLLITAGMVLVGGAVSRTLINDQAVQRAVEKRQEQQDKLLTSCGKSTEYKNECIELENETDPEVKATKAAALAKRILEEQVVAKTRGPLFPVYEFTSEAIPGKEQIYGYSIVKDKAKLPATASAVPLFYGFEAPEIAATELFLNNRGWLTQYYSFLSDPNSGDRNIPLPTPFRVYPMKFPNTKPMYGIRHTTTKQFRIIPDEVAPTGWEIVSPKPLFYAPVPIGEQFGVRGVRLGLPHH